MIDLKTCTDLYSRVANDEIFGDHNGLMNNFTRLTCPVACTNPLVTIFWFVNVYVYRNKFFVE